MGCAARAPGGWFSGKQGGFRPNGRWGAEGAADSKGVATGQGDQITVGAQRTTLLQVQLPRQHGW